MFEILFAIVLCSLLGSLLTLSLIWAPKVVLGDLAIPRKRTWYGVRFEIADVACLTIHLAVLLAICAQISRLTFLSGSPWVFSTELAVFGTLAVVGTWMFALKFLKWLGITQTLLRVLFVLVLFPFSAIAPVAVGLGAIMLCDLVSQRLFVGRTSEAAHWYFAITAACLGLLAWIVARYGTRMLLRWQMAAGERLGLSPERAHSR